MLPLKTKPIPSIDYPTNWSQYLDWFHSEELCRNYLENLRWPTGFICPKCQQSDTTMKSSRARFICSFCKYQATVTAGTIFNKTRTELRVWFAAIWYITNQKHGVSALGLQRVLGINSYETAWTMLHRLRRAMVLADRSLLSGLVEVDETCLALTDRLQPISPKGRKSNTSKILVVIAVEVHSPKGFGRVRIRRIDKGDSEHLIPFVQDNVQPKSIVHTDGSPAYNKLESVGFKHKATVHLGSDIPAHKSMPAIHRVASLLQRWLLGTHHGSVQPHQLDYYLDEYVFRFNRRSSKSRGLLFYRLLQQSVVTEPVTYNDIIR
ncbi:MAG: IS1595 family transposase [Oceanospirillaceae bacterium]|nr:IS1595 family transposase [Oceanospirillaceae bacterium]NQZ33950.1 IS1595 family transposase [Oceanospirillaceae bacterium]